MNVKHLILVLLCTAALTTGCTQPKEAASTFLKVDSTGITFEIPLHNTYLTIGPIGFGETALAPEDSPNSNSPHDSTATKGR